MTYELLVPEYILAGSAFATIALGTFAGSGKKFVGYFAALGAIAALVASCFYIDDRSDFMGLLFIDNFTVFFRILLCATSAFVIIASIQYASDRITHVAEYYGIILFATIGGIGMVASRELLTAYISLELLSFSLYILTSFLKFDRRSNEAGLKYVLLGAFSSAILLYGLSLVYGTAGTTYYDGIAAAFADPAGFRQGMLLGLVLVVVGIGFKISAMPFHMYTPDAYEGAPLPITAFISSVSKAAAFGLFARLFAEAFLPVFDDWQWMIGLLAAITMIMANLIAIQQTNIKRLLAYSSISQVGYMMIAIAVLSPQSVTALLLHMAGYLITNIAVFSCLIAFYNKTGQEEIKDFAGLAERSPFLALMLTLCLFSLAGMPLFAGFTSKFVLFQAGVEGDMLWLTGIAALTSFISLYYYLMVIKQMYLGVPADGAPTGRLSVGPLLWSSISLLVVGVFLVGIWPTPVFKAADHAAKILFT